MKKLIESTSSIIVNRVEGVTCHVCNEAKTCISSTGAYYILICYECASQIALILMGDAELLPDGQLRNP